MEEAPTPNPIYEKETLLLNTNLEFNNFIYNFSIIDINNHNIKLLIKELEKDNENKILLITKKYETKLIFEDLKSTYKYFKMFDNYEETKNDFVELIKRNGVKIINIDEDELVLCIDLKTMTNNLMNVSLKKVIMSAKEMIDFYISELKDKGKKIDELNSEIKIIKNDIKLKDDKIVNLENSFNDLKNRIDSLENKISDYSELKEKIPNIEKNLNKFVESMNKSNTKILNNSSIFQKSEEIQLLSNSISQDRDVSFKLVYSSKLYGENSQKLKAAYIGVKDILVIVKTKKNKRFGGYAHESFEDKEFQKKDSRAFLFNLDKMKIYKSRGTAHTIWNFNLDSIDFGYGTDLRIFHNFLSNENYTNQNHSNDSSDHDFEYDEETFALNGEKYFEILYLEIYKVNFN
jgi:predicted  nucleic acid-binding Zn-ribbon protein